MHASCGCRSSGSSFHVTEHSDIQRDLQMLAEDLHQLEVEYGLFFAGRVPRAPPTGGDTRPCRGDHRTMGTGPRQLLRRPLSIQHAAESVLTYTSLWDRALRAREEGRPGPFQTESRVAGEPALTESGFDVEPAGSRVVYTTAFTDLCREIGKLKDLLRVGDGFAT